MRSKTDEELLRIRICDLGLRIGGTVARVEELHAALEARGIAVRPISYLGAEWPSPNDFAMDAGASGARYPLIQRILDDGLR